MNTTEIVHRKGLLTEKDKRMKGYILYIRRRSHVYNRCSGKRKLLQKKDRVLGEGSSVKETPCSIREDAPKSKETAKRKYTHYVHHKRNKYSIVKPHQMLN